MASVPLEPAASSAGGAPPVPLIGSVTVVASAAAAGGGNGPASGRNGPRKSVLIGVRANGSATGLVTPAGQAAAPTAVGARSSPVQPARNGSNGHHQPPAIGAGAVYAVQMDQNHTPALNVPSSGRRPLNAHVPVQVRTGPGVVLKRVVPASKEWTCLELFRSLGVPTSKEPRIAVRTRNGSASLMEPHDSVDLAITYPQCTQLEFDLPPGLGLTAIPPGTGPQSPVGATISTADGGIVGVGGVALRAGSNPHAVTTASTSSAAHLIDLDGSNAPHMRQQGGTPWEQFMRILKPEPTQDKRWMAAVIVAIVSFLLLVVWMAVSFSAFQSKTDHCAAYNDEATCLGDDICEWVSASSPAPRGFEGPASRDGCTLRFVNARVLGTAFPALITLGLACLCLLWFCTSGQRAGFPVTCFTCCVATSTVLWLVAIVLSVAFTQDIAPMGLSIVVLLVILIFPAVGIKKVRECRAVREDGNFPDACDC